MEDSSTVLFPIEAEGYVQSLFDFELEEIGSRRWMKQHEYLEKLNMQAVLNATQNCDEYIKEIFVNQDKIGILVYDLLLTEIWKEKIFTLMLEEHFEPQSTFPCYVVLHHEAIVSNLLEILMFHKECCECLNDLCLDMVDYCHRKLTYLIARQEDANFAQMESSLCGEEASNKEELKLQNLRLDFDIAARAVSIMRYIIDHMKNLPLSVTTRVLNTHDTVSLFVELIDNCPWIRTNKNGDLEKYIDSKWQIVPKTERLRLSKIEGQIWIAIYRLLMDSEFQMKYKMHEYNKNRILKLRRHLSEVVIDQIPSLMDLQRYLEHIVLVDLPEIKSDLVLEQVPEIRNKILSNYEGKWIGIAKQHKESFSPSIEAVKTMAAQWINSYNLDILESLTSGPPKCAFCGNQAAKRCSRCHNEWYCKRKCQVQHWKKHKAACDLMVKSSKS